MSILKEAFEHLDGKRWFYERSVKVNTLLIHRPPLDRKAVLAAAKDWIRGREPDLVITHGRKGYLERWHYEDSEDRRLYIHRFSGDDPSDLHDHPSHSTSWCLAGRLLEHWHGGWDNVVWSRPIYPGSCVYRSDDLKHRLEMRGWFSRSAFTLFAFGPRRKEWGFYKGEKHDRFIPWREYESKSLVRSSRYDGGER